MLAIRTLAILLSTSALAGCVALDAASGRLLGRSRESTFTELPPMDETFSGNARRFKEAVSRAGKQLVLECLRELRVVPG